jgi:hypothetical protein
MASSYRDSLTRALWASPLLLFTAIAIKAMDVGFLLPAFEEMRSKGEFQVEGHATPIYASLLDTGSPIEDFNGVLASEFLQYPTTGVR